MAEQNRNQAPDSDDVSMDEILTSLRNILEEEDPGQGADEAEAGGESAPAAEPTPHDEDDLASPDEGDDELVLTEVVEEGPSVPEPPAGENDTAGDSSAPATAEEEPGAGEAEFDALFGRWEREEAADQEAAATAPETEAFSEPAADPEGGGPEGLDSGAGWDEPGADGPEIQLDEPGPEAPLDEPSPEAPTSAPEEAAPGEPLATAQARDPETVREAVDAAVRDQVAQATADLESRLADALEPKVREVLQGYLDERLPELLRQLAEAEIERIKKGE